MKKQDLKIIKELRKDSRATLTKISKKIKMPVTTLFYRMKLCQKNLIKKNTILLNYQELGYNTKIALAIKVNKDEKQRLKHFLLEVPFVNSLYNLKKWDFFVELILKHDSDVYDFLNMLKRNFSVEDCEVVHIVDDLKLEKMMS